MLRHITPETLRAPFANYAHAVEVRDARLLFCSGQLGVDAADQAPEDAEGQADLCFANIRAILEAEALGPEHLVRLNAYVSGREHLAGYMRARDRFVVDPAPASTLMIVSGFARPRFVVEVEAIAAAPLTAAPAAS